MKGSPVVENKNVRFQKGDYAGVGARALAYCIDSVAAVVTGSFVTLIVLLLLSVALSAIDSAVVDGILGIVTLVVFVVAFFGYFVVLEYKNGATFGKRIVGIEVAMVDGSNLTIGAAVIRNALRIVDFIAGGIVGAIGIWTSPLNQRVGDVSAGTVVVNVVRLSSVDPSSQVPEYVKKLVR